MNEIEGMKFDQDKLRYDLIPPEVKKWLAEVLTYGAKKYAPDNWKKIEVERYYAAMERHMVAYQLGEEKDPESGIHHLIHMMCNAMFICWLEHHKNKTRLGLTDRKGITYELRRYVYRRVKTAKRSY